MILPILELVILDNSITIMLSVVFELDYSITITLNL